jgi:hypothetical protein
MRTGISQVAIGILIPMLFVCDSTVSGIGGPIICMGDLVGMQDLSRK